VVIGAAPTTASLAPDITSSSDGQFFQAGGFGRDASSINAHYGDQPGVKFYTHLSDRYAPFHTKVIAATASEAAYVLDGLLYHQSEVVARRHRSLGSRLGLTPVGRRRRKVAISFSPPCSVQAPITVAELRCWIRNLPKSGDRERS
jgi:hypothetical protein